jgi:K+-sensing histidine kinase KdpD
MQTIDHMPTLEDRKTISLLCVLLESILAIGGALLVTGIIAAFHLYPDIPNISILYLVIILGLASTFGLYSAVLASLTAFLSFDYFLVPPLYVFTIDRWEEWVALFIFLVIALVTSQLTVILRTRTAQAQRREREAKILYELIRLTNSQQNIEEQLGTVAESIVRVFASWGVQACMILLPDKQGNLTVPAEASFESRGVTLSQEERKIALAAMHQNSMLEKQTAPIPDNHDTYGRISEYRAVGSVTTLRFVPLAVGDHVLGILCLRIQHPVPWFTSVARMQQEQRRTNSRSDFFWTFLEQAISILERSQLRSSLSSSHT